MLPNAAFFGGVTQARRRLARREYTVHGTGCEGKKCYGKMWSCLCARQEVSREGGGTAPLNVILGTRWMWEASLTLFRPTSNDSTPGTHSVRDWFRLHNLSWHFAEEKPVLPLPGIKPRCLAHLDRGLVTALNGGRYYTWNFKCKGNLAV